MTIDKLSRLISALGQPAQNQQSTKTTTTESRGSSQGSSEAVKVIQGFGGGQNSEEAVRKARVAELKEAVADGSYKPDTRSVAEAVARELFA
jgi:anti-sigma28 factor (negative regulator of flagellin synthesis)